MPKKFTFPILRGVISILAIASLFISLKELPLSITTMLIQTTPIWMGLISLFSYNEKPSYLTMISIFLGMIGIVIIVNPTVDFNGASKFLIFPIIVALINALMNLIITKRPHDAKPMSYALVLFILNGFAGLIIWIYFGYKFPNLYQLILISSVIGILGIYSTNLLSMELLSTKLLIAQLSTNMLIVIGIYFFQSLSNRKTIEAK